MTPEKILKKRQIGEFMYSDDSLEKLKDNNSTRLASIKKIKD